LNFNVRFSLFGYTIATSNNINSTTWNFLCSLIIIMNIIVITPDATVVVVVVVVVIIRPIDIHLGIPFIYK